MYSCYHIGNVVPSTRCLVWQFSLLVTPASGREVELLAFVRQGMQEIGNSSLEAVLTYVSCAEQVYLASSDLFHMHLALAGTHFSHCYYESILTC